MRITPPAHAAPATLAAALALALAAAGAAAQHDPGPRADWPAAPVPLLEARDAAATDATAAALEPAIAGGLSAFLPGAGQFYNGQGVKGGLMLAGFAGSILYAVTRGLGDREVCAGQDPTHVCQTHPHWPNGGFWAGLGAATGVYAWSVLDAIAVANRRSRADDAGLGARFELGPHGPALVAGISIAR